MRFEFEFRNPYRIETWILNKTYGFRETMSFVLKNIFNFNSF